MAGSSHTGFHSAIDVGATKVCVVVCRSSGRGVEIVGHGLAVNGRGVAGADVLAGAGAGRANRGVAGGGVGAAASDAVGSDLAATQSAVREAVAMAERRCQLRIGAAYASLAQARGAGLGVDAGAAQNAAEREALVLGIESAGVSVLDCVASSIASAEAVLRDEERQAGVALIDVGARTTDLVVYAGGAVAHTEVIGFGGMTLTAALAERFGISLEEAEFLKRNARVGSEEGGVAAYASAQRSRPGAPVPGAARVARTDAERGGAVGASVERGLGGRHAGSSMSEHGLGLGGGRPAGVLRGGVRGRRGTMRVNSAQLSFPGFYDCEPEAVVAVPNCKHGEGKAIRRADLELVIESRLERLWSPVRRSLEPHAAVSGVVLTGGATLLQGFVAQAEAKLGRRVRRAEPFGIEGLSGQLHSPAFATAVGLALWAARNSSRRERRPTWGRRRLASA